MDDPVYASVLPHCTSTELLWWFQRFQRFPGSSGFPATWLRVAYPLDPWRVHSAKPWSPSKFSSTSPAILEDPFFSLWWFPLGIVQRALPRGQGLAIKASNKRRHGRCKLSLMSRWAIWMCPKTCGSETDQYVYICIYIYGTYMYTWYIIYVNWMYCNGR